MWSRLCVALVATILSSFGLAHPGHDLSNTDRKSVHRAATTMAHRQDAEEVKISLGMNSFSVDAPSTIASHSQDANGLTFSNSQQGDTLAGLLVSGPVKLPFASSFGLIMSSQAGSPLPLGVRLLDTDFKTIFSMQVGVADLAGNGQRFVPLTPTLTGDGNPAAMAAIVFDWNKGTQNPTTISSLVIGRPHVTSMAMTGGRFSLSWLSTAAAHVQRRTSLTEGEWETISTNNSDGSYLDNSTPPGRAYYRLVFPTPTPSPSPTPTPTPAPVPTPQLGEGPPTGMVNVQGGVFSPNLTDSAFQGETAPSFFMAKWEITWDEWKAVRDFAETKGYDIPTRESEGSGSYPVEGITWLEALKWCNARSEKEGLITAYRLNGEIFRTGTDVPSLNPRANGYRLPTNIEWEWAARGGQMTEGYSYSGGNDVDQVAWFSGNASGGKAQLVGTKAPNELGLFDMTGNVIEMLWDHNDSGEFTGRGGFYGSSSADLRVGSAEGYGPTNSPLLGVGLRLVRSYGLVEIDQIAYPVKEEFLEVKVHDFLSEAHPKAKKVIPVVIINYLSSADGTHVIADQALSDGLPREGFRISELNNYFLLQGLKIKASLNEATKFRGFIDPAAEPYATYSVIRYVNMYKMDKEKRNAAPPPHIGEEGWWPDYRKIFAKIGLQDSVENKGAKDIWLFHRWLAMDESNMASPTTGDVSNSYGEDDLPVYSKTYVVYNAPGYSPWQNLLHCMGHQFEAQLSFVDAAFFWNEFVGSLETGWKCGATHFPPNAVKDYDYGNPAYVDSILADWSPDPGRATLRINKDFWARERLFFADLPVFSQLSGWDWASTAPYVGEDGQGGWMITWMQSIPSDKAIVFSDLDFQTDQSAVPVDFVQVRGGILPTNSELASYSVGDFKIAKFEVTLEQWRSVKAWARIRGGYDFQAGGQGSGESYPVHAITWYDAVKWCNAKSEMDRITPVYRTNGSIYRKGYPDGSAPFNIEIDASADGYRLPLEAEWEWAARGGVMSQNYIYSGSNEADEVSWNSSNSGGGSERVGTKAPNELGIHDMSGNLSEYCWDPVGNFRRVRGGDWYNEAGRSAVSVRSFGDPIAGSWSVGFRLARNSNGAEPNPDAPQGPPFTVSNWWEILYEWDSASVKKRLFY